MIAVDTNVLVAAHRTDHQFHETGSGAIEQLMHGSERWCIPWPCAHEFLRVVTGSVFKTPTPPEMALDAVRNLLELGTSPAILVGEGYQHLQLLGRLMLAGKVAGAMVHDARIAAICLAHGVRELWTADRDFSRFPELKTRNPLVPLP